MANFTNQYTPATTLTVHTWRGETDEIEGDMFNWTRTKSNDKRGRWLLAGAPLSRLFQRPKKDHILEFLKPLKRRLKLIHKT